MTPLKKMISGGVEQSRRRFAGGGLRERAEAWLARLRLAEREDAHARSLANLLLGGPLHHGQGQQQHPPQAKFAIFGGVPLGLGVRAAAVAARAHGQGRNAERERDVGVGRAQAQVGAQAQMTIDGAQSSSSGESAGSCAAGRSPILSMAKDSSPLLSAAPQLCPTHWRRSTASSTARCRATSRRRSCSELVERKSMEAWAHSGMELTLVPP